MKLKCFNPEFNRGRGFIDSLSIALGFQPITIQVNSGQCCCDWLNVLWKVAISFAFAQAKVGCL